MARTGKLVALPVPSRVQQLVVTVEQAVQVSLPAELADRTRSFLAELAAQLLVSLVDSVDPVAAVVVELAEKVSAELAVQLEVTLNQV